MKKLVPLVLSSISAIAAQNCASCEPAPCFPDSPCNTCLGPDHVNPSVRPKTCNGDWMLTAAGLYWTAHQDGMEYAIDNSVSSENTSPQIQNNLIDAKYLTPDFKWNFGYKLGFGYNTCCDGWDIGAEWTHYRGKAKSHVEAEATDNHTLLPLWMQKNRVVANPISIPYLSDIRSNWSAKIDLIDVELGREFWTSRYVTLRPFIGLRLAWIKQTFKLNHAGGVLEFDPDNPGAPAVNNQANISNNFNGLGVRSGLNSLWNLSRGWGIYGNLAASLIYGRFDIDHTEQDREASGTATAAPTFRKNLLLETNEHFRATRAIVDLDLGLQWATYFGCDCEYALTVQLGWEQHLFFHQNQMWRVNNNVINPDNSTNLYFQRRGTLSTEGLSLSFRFEF